MTRFGSTLTLLLVAASCRDPATLVGTALLISTDSSEVASEQLRYEVRVDGGLVFDPVLRPPTPAGLLSPTTTVRVLLKDELGGRQAEVTVVGVVSGRDVGDGHATVRIDRGFERLVAVALKRAACTGCMGGDGVCVEQTSAAACGSAGATCETCDPLVADSCVNGRCGCGGGAACTAVVGADRCEAGQCRCGNGPACTAGQECVAQTCQCTPASCPNGCCQGNRCVIAQTSVTCGVGGRACLDCGGTTCSGGLCAMSACNATTCPGGCCVGAACVTSETNFACGTRGMACESCGSGSCDAGSCGGGCNATTCPGGCCLGGVCQPGTSPTACGTGGGACTTCSSECTNQACVDPCGPANCSGCCAQGLCRGGSMDTACGVGGRSCVTCGAGSACSADGGVCVATASCNAATCPAGCCDGATCRPSATTTCGLGGVACASCLTPRTDVCTATGSCGCGGGAACGTGQLCVGGTCVCDPLTCAGCCDGTTCRNGNQKSKCGTGGAVCQNCSGACVMGACR